MDPGYNLSSIFYGQEPPGLAPPRAHVIAQRLPCTYVIFGGKYFFTYCYSFESFWEVENEDAGGHHRKPVSEMVVSLIVKGLLCHMKGVWKCFYRQWGAIKDFGTRKNVQRDK